jgi:hypothetical protein
MEARGLGAKLVGNLRAKKASDMLYHKIMSESHDWKAGLTKQACLQNAV